MEAASGGDREAFTELVRRYERPLYAFALRLGGDRTAAEDLFQETWLRVFRGRGTYHAGRRVSPWLHGIMLNAWRDTRPRGSEEPLSPEGAEGSPVSAWGAQDPARSPDEALLAREQEQQVLGALAHLPEEQRVVVLLRHYQGLRLAEIAQVLGCPVGTVKSRLHGALKTLAPLLRAEPPEM